MEPLKFQVENNLKCSLGCRDDLMTENGVYGALYAH